MLLINKQKDLIRGYIMQQSKSENYKPRRPRAYVNTMGIIQLHLRNPFVVAFWSAMFPGLGHMLLNKFIRGFVLIVWEVFINFQSHINIAILYSFIGEFDKAKEVLNNDWTLLYLPTYVYAIWDSYRSTVTINNLYRLSAREDAPIEIMKMNVMSFNYIDKRSPVVSSAWTALMPGAGQLYLHRIIAAFYIMAWWIVIVYFSKLVPCINYTMVGDFSQAKAVVNPHWLLNVPSIYMFAIYDAYVNTVEYNKLYDWEQSKFLKRDYQNKNFQIPSVKNRGERMHIISTFDYSNNLELAVTAIEMKGIPKDNILAVPMDKKDEERRLFDSMHYADGISSIDVPMILGTFLMIFGCIYGFILTWGPLLWGLIGMGTGIALGLIIKFASIKRDSYKQKNNIQPEVVLIIECTDNQAEMVKDTLWANRAIGVSKLKI
jgi:hypothetical protein